MREKKECLVIAYSALIYLYISAGSNGHLFILRNWFLFFLSFLCYFSVEHKCVRNTCAALGHSFTTICHIPAPPILREENKDSQTLEKKLHPEIVLL